MPQRGRPPHDDILTPAEWRVAEFVRHGLTNPAIAARLGTSADAVKFHVANILVKLGLPSRMELRHWTGIRRGAALALQSHDPQQEFAMGPIGQISRQVRDIAAAQIWFGEVLGLKHLYSFGDLAFFDCGGVRLSCRRPISRATASRSSISASTTSASATPRSKAPVSSS